MNRGTLPPPSPHGASYYGKLIGTRMHSIEWLYFQWPWVIPNYCQHPIFLILYPFSYLRNGQIHRRGHWRSDRAVASASLSLYSSTWRKFWTQILAMFGTNWPSHLHACYYWMQGCDVTDAGREEYMHLLNHTGLDRTTLLLLALGLWIHYRSNYWLNVGFAQYRY